MRDGFRGVRKRRAAHSETFTIYTLPVAYEYMVAFAHNGDEACVPSHEYHAGECHRAQPAVYKDRLT